MFEADNKLRGATLLFFSRRDAPMMMSRELQIIAIPPRPLQVSRADYVTPFLALPPRSTPSYAHRLRSIFSCFSFIRFDDM